MIEINYTKKPSITTLRAAIRKSIAAGADFVQITWGENQITIERTQWGIVGRGWIGRTGGQDLAHELEITRRTGVPAGRLIVSHIGA